MMRFGGGESNRWANGADTTGCHFGKGVVTGLESTAHKRPGGKSIECVYISKDGGRDAVSVMVGERGYR